MGCNGVCIKYKFEKSGSGIKQFYYDGASRCQICTIFIRWDGLFCPCCGVKLRKKPRNKHGQAVKDHIDSKRVGTKKKTKKESVIKVVR